MVFTTDMLHESKGAILSDDRVFRYVLWRPLVKINPPQIVVWVMLNPSKADAFQDDRTIEKVTRFSLAWGFTALAVVNLFAFRSRDPAALRRVPNPVGPDNDDAIRMVSRLPGVRAVVVAWGAVGDRFPNRVQQVRRLLPNVYSMGETRSGQPLHPLYLKGSTELRAWVARS